MWVYSWILFHGSVGSFSGQDPAILMTPASQDIFKSRKCESSNVVLLSQDCLGHSGPCVFLGTLDPLDNSCKKRPDGIWVPWPLSLKRERKESCGQVRGPSQHSDAGNRHCPSARLTLQTHGLTQANRTVMAGTDADCWMTQGFYPSHPNEETFCLPSCLSIMPWPPTMPWFPSHCKLS